MPKTMPTEGEEGASEPVRQSAPRFPRPEGALGPAEAKVGRPAIPPLIRRNTIYSSLAQATQGAGMQVAIALSALMVVRLLGSPALAGIGGSVVGAFVGPAIIPAAGGQRPPGAGEHTR